MVSFYFMCICWNIKGLFLINKAAAQRWKAISIDHDALTTIDKHQIQYVYIYHSEFIDIAHIPLKFYMNVTWKHQYLQTTMWHWDHSNADYWTEQSIYLKQILFNLISQILSGVGCLVFALFRGLSSYITYVRSLYWFRLFITKPVGWCHEVVKLYRTNMKCASQTDITNDCEDIEKCIRVNVMHI